MNPADWIYFWEVWTVIGILALIADMGLGLAYMLLPFGFAAFGVALHLGFGVTLGFLELSDWKTLVILYGVYAVVFVFGLRPALSKLKDDKPDINDY